MSSSVKIVAGWWMVSRAELTKLLDRWEEQRERNPALSVDEFVASFYQNAPASLIAAFRRQVARLQSVDDRIGRVGAIDTTSSSRSDADTDWPRTGFPAFAADVEPIPGYILAERLGAGGFGEVWKATSPGGFSVALKFVAARGRAADVELRALKRIKAVRHPHLLSIFGTWKLDGLLVIASELADGTLLDRFYEARKQGHPGLPRKELLEYFSEAAKGIDFLNRPKSQGGHGIQHRDIKPQNILLAGGSVKVGDFGLARSLEHSATGHTGSYTLAYAAPEFLEGKTSDRSDQYSLAITWCFLRTGKLPFDGAPAQMIAAHLHREPDLSLLPDSERAVLQRALAKNPKDRWDSCRVWVNALRAAGRPIRANQVSPPPKTRIPVKWLMIGGLLLSIAVVSPLVLPWMKNAAETSQKTLPTDQHSESPAQQDRSLNSTSSRPNRHVGGKVVDTPTVDPEGAKPEQVRGNSSAGREIQSTRVSEQLNLPGRVSGSKRAVSSAPATAPPLTADQKKETTDNPTSRWSFDEIADGQLVDQLGTNHGQIRGNPRTLRGVTGNGLHFDGRKDFIAMPLTDFSDHFTFAAWVRPQERPAALCVFATKPPNVFGGNGRPEGMALYLNSNPRANRKIHFQIHSVEVSTAGPAFEFDEWTHLAICVDAVNQHVSLFVNGRAWDDLTIRRAPNPATQPKMANVGHPAVVVSELVSRRTYRSDWRIGAFNDPKAVWFPFIGGIDEVRLYHRVLNQAEITALTQKHPTE